MSQHSRKDRDFTERLADGQYIERQFIERISRMEGNTFPIGRVRGMGSTQLFGHPDAHRPSGVTFSVAPDVLFWLPGLPRNFRLCGQIKEKQVYPDRKTGSLYIFLDEEELHRMNVAHQYTDTYFIIHQTNEAAKIIGFDEWLWVSVDELQQPFYKRRSAEKKAYVIPLNLFHPLEELLEKPNEPANDNQPPSEAQSL